VRVAVLVLLALFLAAAALTWCALTRGERRAWRRSWKGVGAAILLAWLALGAWWIALHHLTSGSRVCFDCGRKQRVVRIAYAPLWMDTVFDGGDYRTAFFGAASRCTDHRWEPQGCTASALGRFTCTVQDFDDWFVELPRLADRAAAQECVVHVRSLPMRQQRQVMNDFGHLAYRERAAGALLDERFATCRADWPERLKR